ncbi:MAG: sugar ABC transporter permease [Clostridia bacterium]|nr:sugar ABC transporter permease [Clostridia bacterium]
MLNQLGFAFYGLLLCVVILTFKFFSRGRLAASYIVLIAMSIVWLFPLLFIVFTSFRAGDGFWTDKFIPEEWSFAPYIKLFTDTSIFMFGKWFLNTLIVAVSTCILSTFIIVTISFVLSRFNFRSKKTLISGMLILGMFPGFMSMIAIYYIIKGLGLSQSLFALILCYSGGSAMGYYVVKGFIDTIPKDIDEAAMIDGASKLQIFFRMILPLSKPIIIYTVLTSFMSPWGDYIFASVIIGDAYESYTVALGLYMMLSADYIKTWYTSFAAGAVLVALPISILFISLNKYYVEGLSGSVKG